MSRLTEIFAFSEAFPLIFTQAAFWIFLAVVYLFFVLVYRNIRIRTTYLFFVSLFFYYKTSGLFVLLLLFTTLSNFWLGKAIYYEKRNVIKQVWLSVSVILNLFFLFYFKYADFLVDALNDFFGADLVVTNVLSAWGNALLQTDFFRVDTIILPIGISFFTFQTITYCVDIYRKKLEPINSMVDYGFFISFFPHLVAGPIVRAAEFIPQIERPTLVKRAEFNRATFLILKGLIKKMVFADFIAMHFLDKVFDAPSMFSGFTNLMALVGYSLQIYGDFSGYTDIAIGLALLMGFHLPLNFNSPYKALNCGEFWKRWHISLSSFLKDYLYIPLGGNKTGSYASILITGLILTGVSLASGSLIVTLSIAFVVFTFLALSSYFDSVHRYLIMNINLMLTMLIGGLWHGASWKFVIWGGLNGLGIIFYKYWRNVSPWEESKGYLAVIWKITLTFCFITFTRLFFRGESMEHIASWYNQVSNNMGWSEALTVLVEYKGVFLVMLLGYITHWLPDRLKTWMFESYSDSPLLLKAVMFLVVALICYQAYSASFQPFIYFQF
jgi:D-alanyl-lipoteichoic acid acyltransferase DltB (MBOAT superfamily)